MFSSIKWKFILIYFLLVFIAMVIVGVFIVEKLEEQQIESVTNSMLQSMENIIESSSYIAGANWLESREEIQSTLNEWRLGANDTLYLIHDKEVPIILASTTKTQQEIIGTNALSYKNTDPGLIIEAFKGHKSEKVIKRINSDTYHKHLAYPVLSSVGKVKGILYMTTNLDDVYNTVDTSKGILTNATLLALGITIILGFLIANSITVPIRDVTQKAEEMAKGDFNQFVEVKSDDEIGQLANMFNYLTLKLKDTIRDMDLERSKLDTIFNYMTEGVLAVDSQNRLIHANLIAMDTLKIEENDIETNSYFDIDSLGIEIDEHQLMEGEIIKCINSQIYKVKYAPFKNEENNIGGLIFVFQDITKEHKLDNMRKEFVANVSHELKTPITAIKSYTETLLEDDIEKPIQNKFLHVIDSECDRMSRLVKDLLQLSNLDYQREKWNKVEISLEDILEEVLFKLNFSFKEKNQKIEFQLEDDIPKIRVDKDGIEQVILNILSNANKYTGIDGKINVKVFKEENWVVLKIIDNGIGISKDDQARIFERFYRVEKGRSRKLGGTGLGLSISKEIINAHDGQISLNSEIGNGSEITIKLPLKEV